MSILFVAKHDKDELDRGPILGVCRSMEVGEVRETDNDNEVSVDLVFKCVSLRGHFEEIKRKCVEDGLIIMEVEK